MAPRFIAQRTAYSGTPEPDGFDLGGRGGGEALVIEIDGPRAFPRISFVSDGPLRLAPRECDGRRRCRRAGPRDATPRAASRSR